MSTEGHDMNGRGEPPVEERTALSSGVELQVFRRDPDRAATATVERPWLLVHGLASNARLWDGVAIELARLGHPVAAVNQRGHGQSSKPDEGYEMETVAEDLRLLIDALGWERPAVAGQSWGGNVVLELGYRHPDSVEVVSCIDGGFIDLRSVFPSWDDAASALAPPPLAGMRYDDVERWVTEMAGDWPVTGRDGTLANFERREDGTIAPWLTAERHVEVLRGLWDHEPSSRYPNMVPPVLLVAADTGDVAWSDSKHRAVDAAMETLPRGRAEWFDAHHDVHAQHPIEVADLLHRATTERDFFDETTREVER